MAVTKFLVSEFDIAVSETSGGTYTVVSGAKNITWSEDVSDIDVTDFDSSGWADTMNGVHMAKVAVECWRKADSTTGTRDAGQKMIEKAARDVTGQGGLRYYRIRWKANPTQYIQFAALAKNGDFGGGVDDAVEWSVELRTSGAPTFTGAFFDPDS